jgi:hypothetical protein
MNLNGRDAIARVMTAISSRRALLHLLGALATPASLAAKRKKKRRKKTTFCLNGQTIKVKKKKTK